MVISIKVTKIRIFLCSNWLNSDIRHIQVCRKFCTYCYATAIHHTSKSCQFCRGRDIKGICSIRICSILCLENNGMRINWDREHIHTKRLIPRNVFSLASIQKVTQLTTQGL